MAKGTQNMAGDTKCASPIAIFCIPTHFVAAPLAIFCVADTLSGATPVTGALKQTKSRFSYAYQRYGEN